jgi:hypothetical protein
MKRFAFIVQPYGQRIQVYFNYPRAALERVMARHGIANDPPWSDVFTAGSVEGRVIVMALFHSTPAVWVERLAHEAYHATQIMHAIYGFSHSAAHGENLLPLEQHVSRFQTIL